MFKRITILVMAILALGVSACGGTDSIEPEAQAAKAEPTPTVDPNVQRRVDLKQEIAKVTTSIYRLSQKGADSTDVMDQCTEIAPKMEAKTEYLADLVDKLDAAEAKPSMMSNLRGNLSDMQGISKSLDSLCGSLGY
jgi:hypothetical protein